MPNKRGRGRTAGDPTLIRQATIERAANTITVTTDGTPDGTTFTLPDTVAGRQVLEGIWAMIPHAAMGGGWASVESVGNGVHLGRTFLQDVPAHFDFGSDAVTTADLEDIIRRIGGKFRSYRVLFRWLFQTYHPKGNLIAGELAAMTFPSKNHVESSTYTDKQYAIIQQAAREAFLANFLGFKRRLADGGIDVTDRNWVNLDADQIITMSTTSDGPAGARLLADIGAGHPDLHPDREVLAAALVHLCMASDKGANETAMLSLTTHSINDNSVVMTKRRGGTSPTVHATGADLHSFQGVATAVRAMTTFNRRHRKLNAPTPVHARNADLLFVPHSTTRTLDYATTRFRAAIGEQLSEPLSLRKLRRTIVKRTKRDTGADQTVGHTFIESGAYLARAAMSDYEDHLYIRAQSDILELSEFAIDLLNNRTNQDPKPPPDSVDRAVTACTTAGIDPETDQWCNRGLAGCFFCESARLTDANIPALRAAVEVAERIESNDPTEWSTGPGPLIKQLAHSALERFDDDDLDAAPDHRQMLPVVAAHYLEIRG